MRRSWRTLGLLLLAACYGTTPQAGEHEGSHHKAHEHGVGLLNIAVEGRELHIVLESPAMNLVGFEHQPRDDKQRAAVQQAVARLKAGDTLFIPSAEADCSLAEAEVESGLLEGHGHQEAAHADFVASYRFDCTKPVALRNITVKLFTTFPATEELAVQLLTEHTQSGMTLSAAKPEIGL